MIRPRKTPVIAVISYKRSDLIGRRNTTWDAACAQDKYPVVTFVRREEYALYKTALKDYNTEVYPLEAIAEVLELDTTIKYSGYTRDLVVLWADMCGLDRVSICDDDLIFSHREDWTTKRIPKLPTDRMHEPFDALFENLNGEYAHVGLRNRAFAQNCTEPSEDYRRIMRVHGVYVPTVVHYGITFEWDFPLMVDFNFQLSVVQAGLKTKVLNEFIVDDAIGPYANEGGCNVYRTDETRTKSAYGLKQKFPEAVTLRSKDTPTGNCLDVTVRFSKLIGS